MKFIRPALRFILHVTVAMAGHHFFAWIITRLMFTGCLEIRK